jgi:hypothetical protein
VHPLCFLPVPSCWFPLHAVSIKTEICPLWSPATDAVSTWSLATDIEMWHGVSKRVRDGQRPPTMWVGHLRKGQMAVSGVACLQGVEGLGKVGPRDT